MNVIFNQLAEIIDKHVLTEKILVVPSRRDGNLAISALVKRGKTVINTKVATFQDLANEYIDAYLIRHNKQLLLHEIGMQYVYEAFTHLKKDKKLTYFQDVQLTPSFIQAAYQTILDLKQVNVTLQNFPTEGFLKKEKADDLLKVFTYYEEKRNANHYIDHADLFAIAKEQITKMKSSTIYILFPHEAFDLIEKEFFESLTKDAKVYVLSHPVVEGLKPLKEVIPSEKEYRTNHPLRYLFHVEKGIEQDLSSLTLSASLNEDGEIQDVLRTLRKKSIPYDQAVIYYTSGSPYVESILRYVHKLNIPVTFAEGVPLRFTKVGKFLRGLMEWVREDYSVTKFTKLLREDVFRSEALPFSTEKMIDLIRRCEIRFGKERYLKKIEEKISHYESNGGNEEFIEQYRKLLHWFQQWLSYFPASKLYEKINYEDWLLSIAKLLNNYVIDDIYFSSKIIEEIEQLAKATNYEFTFGEGLSFSEQWLLKIPVGASLPKPGHLHISPYRIGLYVDREYVFIVGMDNSKFPGRMTEDPLLLDEERRNIHPQLTLGYESITRNIYLFTQLLLTTNEYVRMSFPFMDTVENRVSAPSHLFLQLYRMKEKNVDITGEDLIERVKNDVHFITTNDEMLLEPAEWLSREIWQEKKLSEPLLKEGDYANIIQALKARNARMSDKFTEYDGLVGNAVGTFDPRNNEQIVMTASKLENLGSCPYSYFLQHVLKVEDEDEEEFDRYRWLDAPTRGTILHKVFETIYVQLVKNQEKPKLEEHLTTIFEICEEILAREKELNPPPSEIIFELERLELLESCSLFLKAEEEASIDGEPLYFEFSFGMGNSEPAKIEVSESDYMMLRGKIDRIDRLQDGTYQIIDYKTGSTYGFFERNYFNGGRKLQHTLYALAFEKLFSPRNWEVSLSIYSFPTLKGGGERVDRKQTPHYRESFLQIINRLCDMLQAGHFPYTDSEDDCRFCEFHAICSRHTYNKEQLERKQLDEGSIGYQALREVRGYD